MCSLLCLLLFFIHHIYLYRYIDIYTSKNLYIFIYLYIYIYKYIQYLCINISPIYILHSIWKGINRRLCNNRTAGPNLPKPCKVGNIFWPAPWAVGFLKRMTRDLLHSLVHMVSEFKAFPVSSGEKSQEKRMHRKCISIATRLINAWAN